MSATRETVMQSLLDDMSRRIASNTERDVALVEAIARTYATLHQCVRMFGAPAGLDSRVALRDTEEETK